MAKSKSGGTRSYLRGKIGADVYSIGKDGKGKKQQVVRSLAEVVANPQTLAQMRGRMIMSTVMQAVSALKPIIDHSFDGIPTGQPCISEFIRRNYALIKADVAAHPSSGNSFGLVKYGEKAPHMGKYVISDGSAIIPLAIAMDTDAGSPTLKITIGGSSITMAQLKEKWELSSDEYITLVAINLGQYGDPKGAYCRFRLNPAISDETVIKDSNLTTAFVVEGNISFTGMVTDGVLTLTLNQSESDWSAGFIVSRNVDGAWVHSECTLINGSTVVPFTADVALPTYPIGSEQYLNGGDL